MSASARPRTKPAVLCAAMFLSLCIEAARAEEETVIPLPRWSREEISAMRANPDLPPLLGELIGRDEEQQERPPAQIDGGPVGDSPERAQPSADLSRFLPPSLLNKSSASPSAPPPRSTRVPPGFLQSCAETPAAAHLIDPNHELSETSTEDFERFLVFHASDTRIPLKLLILGHDQELPADVNLSNVAGGSMALGQCALVACPYGAVWRTRLFVSQPILDTVPSPYLTGLLDDCIRDARRATDPDEQLHRLLVRLSVRLFWMQRMLATAPVAAPASAPLAAPGRREALAEVVAPGWPAARRAPPQSWLPPLPSGPGAGLLAVLLFGTYAAWRWHRYKLRHYQWLLPEPDASSRFGSPVSGGGASIRYR